MKKTNGFSKSMSKMAIRFARDESGATAVEYGVLIAVIAAVIITVVFSIGIEVEDAFTFVEAELGNVTQP